MSAIRVTDEHREIAKAILRHSEGWHDDMVDDIATALAEREAAARADELEKAAEWSKEQARLAGLYQFDPYNDYPDFTHGEAVSHAKSAAHFRTQAAQLRGKE